MIDTRGMDPNMDNAEACNDGIYLYNPGSGIINLIKVKEVKVAKEKRAKRRRE